MKIDKKERKRLLTEAYEELIKRKDYLELIKIRASANLGRFSLGNLSMLMFESYIMERPMPTFLHTYKDWQKLKRQVKAGSGGLNAWHVFAPMKKWITDQDDPDQRFQIITGFRVLSQFDITQTEGPPIAATPPRLQSSDHLASLELLIEDTIDKGIPVYWLPKEKMGGAEGWYTPKDASITLQEGMAPDEMLAVLIHERIHAQGIGYTDFTREEAEMICESASAIVGMGLGLDHLERSLDYIANWAGTTPERAISVFEKAEAEATTLEQVFTASAKEKEVAA